MIPTIKFQSKKINKRSNRNMSLHIAYYWPGSAVPGVVRPVGFLFSQIVLINKLSSA